MSWITKLSRFMLFSLTLIGISASSYAQSELDTERFLMTFVPNIQFSPLYVAIEQGYFADAGVTLEVEYLNEPDVIDLVAAEQADFGVVSGEQVLLSVSQGRPILYVYDWFQTYPIGIVTSADSGIETAADLVGQRVGLPGRFGATYSGLVALLRQAGVTEAEILLDEIGFNAPEVFCLGVIDAAVVYINNEPLQIRNRAEAGECGDVTEVRVIPVASALNLVSNGIVTRQDFAEENPEHVTAIIGAWDAGRRDVTNNPARAYLLSAPYIDGLPLSDALRDALAELADAQDTFLATEPDRETIAASRLAQFESLSEQFASSELLQFEVLLATIDLWDVAEPGISPASDWENMQATLIDMGLIQEPLDLDTIYTNRFVISLAD